MFENIFSDTPQGVVYLVAAPLHLIAILLEMAYGYWIGKKLYDWKDTLTNVYFSVCNYGLDLVFKGIAMLVMFYGYEHRFFTWETGLMYGLAVFLLQDFAYYVHHYCDHHVRMFWAVHVTHHSSEYFNITTGFRSPVLQPLYRYVFFAPIALLGFNPWHILTAYAITQIYGTWVHTQTIQSMGFLEKILVTPSHHRVHHASNDCYIDKNMGMGLIIWDRLFGTFAAERPEEPVRFGITKPLTQKNPINLIFHEWFAIWQDIRSAHLPWTTRLKFLFYPPGWKP